MKKLLLFSVVGLLVLVLSACSSDNTPEGVTTKAIQCIIDKDYQGYIDLMFFRKEQTDHDKQQLAALVQDKMGNLWIGFDGGGLIRRDPTGHDVHFTKQNGSLPTNIITCSMADAQGRFWVGTFGSGVLQWDGKGKFVKYPLHDAKGDEILFVRCMTTTPDGSIWIGSLFQGVFCMGKDGSSRLLTMENSELRTGSITSLYSDAENHLYIGTSTGFYVFDIRSGKFPKRTMNTATDSIVSTDKMDCRIPK